MSRSLHEIFETQADSEEWYSKLTSWGDQFIAEAKENEPLLNRFEYTDEKWEWKDYFRGNHRTFIIMNDDDNPCGYVIIRTDRYRSSRKTMNISEMFIEKEYRSQGIGSFVLEQLSSISKSEQHLALFVQHYASNVRASRFYNLNGFFDWAMTKAKFNK